MPKRTTDYRSTLMKALRDPTEAAQYLNAALMDSEEMFFTALRDVAEARQMAKIAESAGVSRESLYRMLTPGGNPTSRNLFNILKALDINFSISSPDQSLTEAPAPTAVNPVGKIRKIRGVERPPRRRNQL